MRFELLVLLLVGWIGWIDAAACASNPCQNGGTCFDAVNLFICTCPIGFQGNTCQIVGASTHCSSSLSNLDNTAAGTTDITTGLGPGYPVTPLQSQTFSVWVRVYATTANVGPGVIYVREACSGIGIGANVNTGRLSFYDYTNLCDFGPLSMDISTAQNPFWVMYVGVNQVVGNNLWNKTLYRNGVSLPLTNTIGSCTQGVSFNQSCAALEYGNLYSSVSDLRMYQNTVKTDAEVLAAYNNGWPDQPLLWYRFMLLTSTTLFTSSGITVSNNDGSGLALAPYTMFTQITTHGTWQTNCACASNPCQNGGSCADHIGTPGGSNYFNCTCAAGYSGTLCQININECASNPCANGGTCTDLVNGFTCACADGFIGATCSPFAACTNGTLCNTCVNAVLMSVNTSSTVLVTRPRFYAKMWGAGGGRAFAVNNFAGTGAYASFRINTNQLNTFVNITIGGGGQKGTGGTGGHGLGGSNGGGNGGFQSSGSALPGGGGGGATSLIIGSREVAVAAGGGGTATTTGSSLNGYQGGYGGCSVGGVGGTGDAGCSLVAQGGFYLSGVPTGGAASSCSSSDPGTAGTAGVFNGSFIGFGGDGGVPPPDFSPGGGGGGGGVAGGGGGGDSFVNGRSRGGGGGSSGCLATDVCTVAACSHGDLSAAVPGSTDASWDGVGGGVWSNPANPGNGNRGFVAIHQCATGWAGDGCNCVPDSCASSPCQNGATCVYDDFGGGWTCDCISGTSGIQCQIQANLCLSAPCLNGGTCILGAADYTCVCASGYSGANCLTDINECASVPCANGGTCFDHIGSFSCVCSSGFSGKQCQTNVNECSSNPCINGGTCVDGTGSFTCTCPSAFSGSACQTPLTCASHPCQNGATCVGDFSSYTCNCIRGFSGALCQTDIDECASQPCANGGTCVDHTGFYTCICTNAFMGAQCQTPLYGCQSSPCLNGGTCNPFPSAFTCTCVPGFIGAVCQTTVSECASSPCRNGGTCGQGASSLLLDESTTINNGVTAYNSRSITLNTGVGIITPVTTYDIWQIDAVSGGNVGGLFISGGQKSYDGVLFGTSAVFYPMIAFGHLGTNDPTLVVDTYIASGSHVNYGGSPSVPRAFLTATGVGQTYYCAGGQTVVSFSDFSSVVDIIELFNYSIPAWSVAGHLSVARTRLASAFSLDVAIFAGGIASNGAPVDTVDIWNTTTSSMTTSHLSIARFDIAAASVGSIVVFGGGFTDVTFHAVSRIDIYNSAVSQWTTRELPYSAGGISATSIVDSVLFAGGSSFFAGGVSNVVLYNTISGQFQTGSMNAPRTATTIFSYQTYAVIVGGSNNGAPSNYIGHYVYGATVPTGFSCTCAPGFIGNTCNTTIGNCTQSGCVCLPGYTGNTCQTEINECASNPCQNNGGCIDLVNAFSCVCLAGFSGTLCQTQIDQCASTPCMNSGTCVDRINGFSCLCPGFYFGAQCELTPCSSAPCQLSGTCVDSVNGYTCHCQTGTTGSNCQTNIDDCASSPCQNGGICTDGIGSFTCTCQAGYVGTICNTRVPQWCDTAGGLYSSGTAPLRTIDTGLPIPWYPLSIAMWIRSGGDNIFAAIQLTDFSSKFLAILRFGVSTGSDIDGLGFPSVPSGGDPMPANTWTHVAATFTAPQVFSGTEQQTVSLYQNGQLVSFVSSVGSLLESDYAPHTNRFVTLQLPFGSNAQLDQLRIYATALTGAQVAAVASLSGSGGPTPVLAYQFRLNIGTNNPATPLVVSTNDGSGGTLNLTRLVGTGTASFAPCGCNDTNLCQNGGFCYDLHGTYPGICSCITIPHGTISGAFCQTITCNSGFALPGCGFCLPGYYGDNCDQFGVPCNSTDVAPLCGYGATGCVKRCESLFTNCTLGPLTCECIDGFEQPNPAFCGYRYQSDLCTQPNPPAPTFSYQISECGTFVTNSSGFVCPTPGPHFSTDDCVSECQCASGSGQTPGSVYACSGFDEICNPADVLEFCSSANNGCTKRCEYDPVTPNFKSYCVFNEGSCVPIVGHVHPACTPTELDVFCGGNTTTASCQTDVLNGAILSHTCTCTSSAVLLSDGTCTPWVYYDQSDNSTAVGSNCTTECGPNLLTTPYATMGDSYPRGQSFQCAKRRYWSQYAPFVGRSSFSAIEIDFLFQQLVAARYVVWNGTGWSDNSPAFAGQTFLFPFWVRNCDCMAPYPIAQATAATPLVTNANGMLYNQLSAPSGTQQLTVLVYSTYASVETVIPGDFRRLYACHGIYVKTIGPSFGNVYCPTGYVVVGTTCVPTTCSTGQSFCGSRGCIPTASSLTDCGGCGRICTGSCTNGICTRSPTENNCALASSGYTPQCDLQNTAFCLGNTCTAPDTAPVARCTGPSYQCINQNGGTPFTPNCQLNFNYARCDDPSTDYFPSCQTGVGRCVWGNGIAAHCETSSACGSVDVATCAAMPGSSTTPACSTGSTPVCPSGALACDAGNPPTFSSSVYASCDPGGSRPICSSGTSPRCSSVGGAAKCCTTCTPGTIPTCPHTSPRCINNVPVCENEGNVNPTCATGQVPVCFQELAVCCNKPALNCTEGPCPAFPPGQVQCGTATTSICTTLVSDNSNCGFCGNVCNAVRGQTCVNSKCTATCTALGSLTCGAYCCGSSDTCINGVCVNGQSVNPLVVAGVNTYGTGIYFIGRPVSSSLYNSLTGLLCSGRGTVGIAGQTSVIFAPIITSSGTFVVGQPSFMQSACVCNTGWIGSACEIQSCCLLRSDTPNQGILNGNPAPCVSPSLVGPGKCGVALNQGVAALANYWPTPDTQTSTSPCQDDLAGGSGCCEYNNNEFTCNSNSLIVAGTIACMNGFLLYTELGTICVCNPGFQNRADATATCTQAFCSGFQAGVPCYGNGRPRKYYNSTLGAITDQCVCNAGWVGLCCNVNVQCSSCDPSSFHADSCRVGLSVSVHSVKTVGFCSTDNTTGVTTCDPQLAVPLNTLGATTTVTSVAFVCSATTLGSWSGGCCSSWTWSALGPCVFPAATSPVTSVSYSWNGTNLILRSGSTYDDQPQCACSGPAPALPSTSPYLPFSGPFCKSSSCPLGCGTHGTCQSGSCRQVQVGGGQALCGVNGAYSNQYTGCNCEIDQFAGCGSSICSSNQGTCAVTYSNSSQLVTSCVCPNYRTGVNCEFGACGPSNCNSPAGTCVVPSSGPAFCTCATTAQINNRIFGGTNCDVDVTPECGVATGFSSTIVACNLHGTCSGSLVASNFSCSCASGFTGVKCTIQPCSPTCTHGTCTPGSGGSSSCICNQLYTIGDGSCSVNTCANGGVPAHPNKEAPQGTIPAAICVCNNATKSFSPSHCVNAMCPTDSNGVECGTVNPNAGGINNINILQATSTSCVCQCAWSGALNTTSGICIPRCSPDPTKTISTNSIIGSQGGQSVSIFTSCTCQSGYYNFSGCYERTCLNGGFLSGSTCICVTGFSGARCELAQCSGVGFINGTSCACPSPYYGTTCQFNLCAYGTPNVTSGGCSNCPFATNGTYCQLSRCGAFGNPSPSGTTCTCVDPSITGPFCTNSSCTNGGVINPTQPFQCICPPQYTGFFCNYGTCGPAGVYFNGTCTCTNSIVLLNPATGNCTASICGPFGILNATYTGCTCIGNSTLLPRTDPGHSVLCIPNCPANSVYDDAIHACRFLTHSSSAQPISSSALARSSSGVSHHSSSAVAHSSSAASHISSTAAATAPSSSSSTGMVNTTTNSTTTDAFTTGTSVVIIASAIGAAVVIAAVVILAVVPNFAAPAAASVAAVPLVATAGNRRHRRRHRQRRRELENPSDDDDEAPLAPAAAAAAADDFDSGEDSHDE